MRCILEAEDILNKSKFFEFIEIFGNIILLIMRRKRLNCTTMNKIDHILIEIGNVGWPNKYTKTGRSQTNETYH